MIRYTTPTLTVSVAGADLTNCRVWLSFEQRAPHTNSLITEFDVEVTSAVTIVDNTSYFDVTLTQEQSSSLRIGPVMVQVNWMTSDGVRKATPIGVVGVQENIYGEVLAYE